MIEFETIKKAASVIDRGCLLFSSGKDSIVTLDLCSKHMNGKFDIVYMYKVKGISFREEILKYYENRFNIKIHQIPHNELMTHQAKSYDKKGKKSYKMGDMEDIIRRKFNVEWLIYGYKKQDFLTRRIQLNQTGLIDDKYKKLYPVGNWTDKEIFYYLEKNKLPLPIEYNYGFNNIDTYKGDALLFVYNNYPDDFKKIQAQYPFIGAELLRMGIEI